MSESEKKQRRQRRSFSPEPKAYREILLGPDMYHLYDYSLFYVNIRQNAQIRVKTFLQGVATQ